MKGSFPVSRRTAGKSFRPSLEALEERQLLSGFQIRLEQPGFDPLTVNDNGPRDINPAPGVITFFGAYGTFPINAVTGISLRSASGEQQLLLNSVNVAGPTGGALRILLADDNYLPAGPQVLRSDFGSVLPLIGSSIGFQSWLDPTNSESAAGLTPGQHGPTSLPAAAGSLSSSFNAPSGPSSLVNEVNLVLAPGAVTSFTLYTSLSALQQPEQPEINPDPGLIIPE